MLNLLPQSSIAELCSQQVIPTLPLLVKQLVDNSLDANATTIRIILSDYGKQAIQKGATSKKWQDGYQNQQSEGTNGLSNPVMQQSALQPRPSTLGFRGEALHSISRVCGQLTIKSRTTSSESGFILQLPSLARTSWRNCPFSHGTTVDVSSVFENLPVRRNELLERYRDFLRETYDLIREYSIGYYNVCFILTNIREGQSDILLQTTLGLDLRSRIGQLFGAKTSNGLVSFLEPLISGQLLSRIESGSGRENAHLKKTSVMVFLNKRPINPPKSIYTLLERHYRKYSHNAKFFAILFLSIPFEATDINLTPDKRDVMIRRQVLDEVVNQIRNQIEVKVVEAIQRVGCDQNNGFDRSRCQSTSRVSFTSQASQQSSQIEPSSEEVSRKHPFSEGASKINPAKPSQTINSTMLSSLRSHMQTVTNSTKIKLPESNAEQKTQMDKMRVTHYVPKSQMVTPVPSVSKIEQQVKSKKEYLKQKQLSFQKSNTVKEIQPPMSKNVGGLTVSLYQPKQGASQDSKVEKVSTTYTKPQIKLKQQAQSQQSTVNGPLTDQIGINAKSNGIIGLNPLQNNKNPYKVASVSLPSFSSSFQKQNFERLKLIGQFNKGFILAFLETAGSITYKSQQIQRGLEPQQSQGSFTQPSQSQRTDDEQGSGRFYLIDQHAVSEKGIFEKFISSKVDRTTVLGWKKTQNEVGNFEQPINQNQLQKSSPSSELLLGFSYPLTPIQADCIAEHEQSLKQDGFIFTLHCQPSHSLTLHSAPIFFNHTSTPKDLIHLAINKTRLMEDLSLPFVRKAASKACRTAVMVGDVLSWSQMEKLVKGMAKLKSPWNCPHGRPTMIELGNPLNEGTNELALCCGKEPINLGPNQDYADDDEAEYPKDVNAD